MGVAVLVSGSGSILEAILAAATPVDVVVADRACRALAVAESAGVPAVLARRTEYGRAEEFDRSAYTDHVVAVLEKYDVAAVAMAGFGTVMPSAADAYPGRMLNTHPSLLPAFPGWHAVRDALAHGVKVTGCTIHVVTSDLDAGPILAQEAVPVLPGDTVETLHERIKHVERRLYPPTIRRFLEEVA